jgi:hypothetical protein
MRHTALVQHPMGRSHVEGSAYGGPRTVDTRPDKQADEGSATWSLTACRASLWMRSNAVSVSCEHIAPGVQKQLGLDADDEVATGI